MIKIKIAHLGLAVLQARGFRLRTFTYRNSPVHYVEGGRRDGPVLAVLPGFGDTIYSWTALLLRYARDFHVIGLDFPGYTGLSPHPPGPTLTFADQDRVAELFLRDEVCRLRGRADFLLGNSMGGWQSFRLAARFPELVGNIIALNPAGVFLDEAETERIRELYVIRSYGDYLKFMRHLWHRIPAYFYPFSLLGGYQFALSPVFQTLLSTVEPEHTINELLATLEAPVTLIWGESDRLLPISMAELIVRTAPNVTLHRVPNSGHMPQIETPSEVYRIIDAIRPSTR